MNEIQVIGGEIIIEDDISGQIDAASEQISTNQNINAAINKFFEILFTFILFMIPKMLKLLLTEVNLSID